MGNDFYERKAATHLDGTPIFRTEEDEKNEQVIAGLLSTAWNCNIHSFGVLSAIDWFAERDGRIIGVLELKCRSHETTTYPTVFLNVRKWLALLLGAVGLGVPAIFVVRFTDSVRWIEIAKVDGTGARMGGCSRFFSSRANIEPMIEVPVGEMHELISREGPYAPE